MMFSGASVEPDLSNFVQFNTPPPPKLDAPLRFLLTCGPLPDINISRSCLDETVAKTAGKLSKLRMKMALFNPLEWAAKKGNTEIVEWLCTDGRTKCFLDEGCPVGWACYTGQLDVARKLVLYGADPSKTDDVLFYSSPPLLLPAENGQLESMKYLVLELGQDIHTTDVNGRNILQRIKTNPNWKN